MRFRFSSDTTIVVDDGDGNRVRQIVADGLPIITDYLNDVQPELTKLLAQTTGANTEHYLHAPRGIHAQQQSSGDWTWYAQDGLGSVRGLIDDSALVQSVRSYDPVGNPMGSYPTGFGFTGEQTDVSGDVFLRARYMNPSLGTFRSLDPFEGVVSRPMSLNGYSWVEGNPVVNVDPSGMLICSDVYKTNSTKWKECAQQNITLRRTYGIALIDKDELNNWTSDRVNNMFYAVRAIDNALGQISFSSVFGGTSQTYIDQSKNYCASTPGTNSISWYDCGSYARPYSVDNIIHEFGHILQNRAGTAFSENKGNSVSMSGMWDYAERSSGIGSIASGDETVATSQPNPWEVTTGGLGFNRGIYRQNTRSAQLEGEFTRQFEEVADMFLYWVQGYSFSTSGNEFEQRAGDIRRAFVYGDEYPFKDANGGPFKFPSILDWIVAASRQGQASTYHNYMFVDYINDPCYSQLTQII